VVSFQHGKNITQTKEWLLLALIKYRSRS